MNELCGGEGPVCESNYVHETKRTLLFFKHNDSADSPSFANVVFLYIILQGGPRTGEILTYGLPRPYVDRS